MTKAKDANGNYFVTYVLEQAPKGVDTTVWNVAVTDYLKRNGVELENVTPNTTMANTDWPEIRRIYNRLVGEGKQRRSENSSPKSDVTIKEVK
jgi:hypothetical protein